MTVFVNVKMLQEFKCCKEGFRNYQRTIGTPNTLTGVEALSRGLPLLDVAWFLWYTLEMKDIQRITDLCGAALIKRDGGEVKILHSNAASSYIALDKRITEYLEQGTSISRKLNYTQFITVVATALFKENCGTELTKLFHTLATECTQVRKAVYLL